ncbi:MAG: hypothetical protein AVDCRST_MAG59-2920, partial [uncultured Thermomicrobiales bacterium]
PAPSTPPPRRTPSSPARSPPAGSMGWSTRTSLRPSCRAATPDTRCRRTLPAPV